MRSLTVAAANLIVSALIGMTAGRWFQSFCPSDVAFAFAGFIGYMGVMAVELLALALSAYFRSSSRPTNQPFAAVD